ncbi:hypothetical protein LCGC14_1544310 [marine sediment metagenome]|uniref:Right handed beta helix domain-containing protein n=1 Tax=marine sediment metagenome TaxID=412755 RepID=A0A0F9L885_9ZZZZ
MTQFGPVSGTVDGPCTFLNGPVTFTQGAAGAGLVMPDAGKIWYVNKNKVTGITGNGTTPAKAFLTVTEGFAALSNYDVLIIAPGNYDEAGTLNLTSLTGVKIFGYGTGFQWNEGSTCIRDVTSGEDLVLLTSCKAIEIAGIAFINSQAFDGITFSGINYSTHIHDCSFVGDTGGGATGDIAIDLVSGSYAPDLYVHHCRFLHMDEAGINMGVSSIQRFVMHDCLFIVPDAAFGIKIHSVTSGYNAIWDCKFLGTAGDGNDQGIDIDASTGDGQLLVTDCRFSGITMTGGGTGAEVASTENYKASAAGGVIIDPT